MQSRRLCPTCQAEFTAGEQFCAYDAAPLLTATERESESVRADVAQKPAGSRASAAVTVRDPLLGTIIANRYKLCEILGEGGMGVVYRAEHTILERLFAVKVLRRELTLDSVSRGRFDREARAASLVCHSHIVTTYDYGYTESGLAYLVMEYLDGMTLAAYAYQTPGHTLPLGLSVEVALQVAQALQHAHERGVVHRDIKPTNVLLTSHDGEGNYVKVLDFGIARILDQAALTMVKDGPPGTLPYMAPEMFSRVDYLSPAVDQYALGVLLFHVLSGDPPFGGNDMEVVRAHLHKPPPRLSEAMPEARVPAALEELLLRLLAKEPAARPTAAETVERLMQIQPQLAPRSLRSLVALQTMILNESQKGLALHAAQTYVLPYNRPGQPGLVRSAELLPTLHELDQLESDLQRVSGLLAKQALALLRKRWPRGALPAAPTGLLEVAQRVGAAEVKEEEHGLHLALLREQVQAEQQRIEGRRAELHRRLIAQRDVMRQGPATAEVAARQEEALAALEREYLTALPTSTAATKLHAAQAELQELQAAVHALRRQLAGQTLRAYLTDVAARGGADGVQEAAYRQLEETLALFDQQTAAVTLVAEKLG